MSLRLFVSTLSSIEWSLCPFALKTNVPIASIYIEPLHIFHILKRFDPFKSHGLPNLPNGLLRLCCEHPAIQFIMLFEFIISTAQDPAAW